MIGWKQSGRLAIVFGVRTLLGPDPRRPGGRSSKEVYTVTHSTTLGLFDLTGKTALVTGGTHGMGTPSTTWS